MAAFPSKRECILELPNKIIVVKVLRKWCGIGAVKEKTEYINDFVVFK